MSVRLDQRVLRVLLFLAGLALTLEGCTPVRLSVADTIRLEYAFRLIPTRS
jgi:hypothetical protein